MEVVKAPDNKLRVQTKTVKKITPGLLKTFKEMIRLTKTFQDPEGVGLAATQIGQNQAYFVGRMHDTKKIVTANSHQLKDRWLNYDKDFSVFINPKIISFSKRTKKYFEGCLSIPNIWGEVKRAISIKASYQTPENKNVTKTLSGVAAWIFQHEVDHLNGVLFSDRVLEQKGKFYKYTGKDSAGADTFVEVTI